MTKKENVDRLRASRWLDGVIKKARRYSGPAVNLIEEFVVTKHKLVAALRSCYKI